MISIPFNGSPVLGPDGTIYAVAGKATARYEDDGSALYALRPDGQLKWVCLSDFGIWGDPLIGSEGSIYIQAIFGRKVTGGITHDTVVTLEPETRRVLAPKELNSNVHGLIMDSRGIFYCSPDWDQRDFGAWTGGCRGLGPLRPGLAGGTPASGRAGRYGVRLRDRAERAGGSLHALRASHHHKSHNHRYSIRRGN